MQRYSEGKATYVYRWFLVSAKVVHDSWLLWGRTQDLGADRDDVSHSSDNLDILAMSVTPREASEHSTCLEVVHSRCKDKLTPTKCLLARSALPTLRLSVLVWH